jgi:hypothetical protein
MKLLQLICLIILLSLATCKSDEDIYPIIEPGAYLPVYPNSSWTYLYNDSLIIVDSSSDQYMLHNYYNSCQADHYSDKVYVPFYYRDSASPCWFSGPVYGYNWIQSSYNYSCYAQVAFQYPILKTGIGKVYRKYPGDHYTEYYQYRMTVKDKIFNGKDSVLIIEEQFLVYESPVYNYTDILHFTKNIGLTSDVRIDTLTQDTLSKWILIDYYIGR